MYLSPYHRLRLFYNHFQDDRFSPKQIRRRKRQTLIEILKQFGTLKAEKTAVKLQQYAAKVLHAPVEYVDTIQVSLELKW